MTKQELLDLLEEYDDEDEIDINEIMEEAEMHRQRVIEELEERQHASGFFAFQDEMEIFRRERE